MKAVLIAAALLLPAGAALAEDTNPQRYTISLSAQELAVIGEGLGEVAAKRAVPVIQAITQQVTSQQQAAKAAAAPPPPGPPERPAPPVAGAPVPPSPPLRPVAPH